MVMWLPSLKKDATASQSLATGPLLTTTTYGRKAKIESVMVHASVAITETVKITLVSAWGANFNEVLSSYDLVSEQDFVWRPQGEMNIQSGDSIRVTCTNANGTGTVYSTIKASEVLN